MAASDYLASQMPKTRQRPSLQPHLEPERLPSDARTKLVAEAQLLRDHGLWDDREFVTLTIDGTGTDEALWEGICYARKVRVYYITPSGTRKVRAKVYASFKRMN